MTKYALPFALLLASATAHAAPIATFTPPLTWSYPGQPKLGLTEKPDGGPGGQTWTEVSYSAGAYANFRAPQPLALPPGALLKVWVKGNGSKDVLYLYLFGGAGHRGYNLPLNDTNWKQLTFDISEDFGENDWNWATPSAWTWVRSRTSACSRCLRRVARPSAWAPSPSSARRRAPSRR